MWGSVISGIVGTWRGLNPSVRGFILGLVVGLIGLSLFFGLWHTTNRTAQIALENANAAADSTRKVSAGKDTIYARIIAQKDVQLAGAIKAAADKQHDKPKAVVAVAVSGGRLDTTATHRADPECEGALCRMLSDSLVLRGKIVHGAVTATIRDSTWYWTARLEPAPINLTLALTCSKKGPEVLATGPPWVSTSIGSGQVDPNVCHPAPSKWFSGFKSGVVFTGAVYVGFRVVKALIQKGK